jgi:TatD DNase family protein
MKLFNAHTHLPAASGRGADLALCNGTNPEDWEKVLELSADRPDIFPFFGLHPWFVEGAAAGWPVLLEEFLRRVPSGIGEIGLDKAVNADLAKQEHAFRAQLRLAKKLGRPSAIHCAGAWGMLEAILKEELPPAFLMHSYGGPPEMMAELAALGAYCSFGAAAADPRRAKMRKALLAAPRERLLLETEASGPEDIGEVMRLTAGILGKTPDSLGELAWRNAGVFLGDSFRG